VPAPAVNLLANRLIYWYSLKLLFYATLPAYLWVKLEEGMGKQRARYLAVSTVLWYALLKWDNRRRF
jgi:hypothetical protein